LFFLLSAGGAAAGDRGRTWNLAIGPSLGVQVFDHNLADYRWDTKPAVVTGLQATLYRGRLAGGFRMGRSHTRQDSGIPGETRAPRVNKTDVVFTGHARVVKYRFFELWGAVSGGGMFLGYDPDRITFDIAGGLDPVTVTYESVSTWQYGLGTGLRSIIARHVAFSLEAERSTFFLDTAHRRADEIVYARESFSNWHFRIQVAWLVGRG
jgi:hypothetical protein